MFSSQLEIVNDFLYLEPIPRTALKQRPKERRDLFVCVWWSPTLRTLSRKVRLIQTPQKLPGERNRNERIQKNTN